MRQMKTDHTTWDIDPLAEVLESLNVKRISRVNPEWLATPSFVMQRLYNGEIVEDCGKGLTMAQAFRSMLFEAIERSAAENASGTEFLHGSYQELVDSHNLCWPPRFASGIQGVDELCLEWVIGDDLMTGAKIYVPCDCVYFPYDGTFFPATTTGLAANMTMDKAVLHAIFEVIERDTLYINTYTGLPRRAISFSPEDQPSYGVYQSFLDAGIEVTVELVSNDLKIPVVLTCFEKIPQMPGIKVAGIGCHLDPQIAAIRSMTECSLTASYWSGRGKKADASQGKVFRPPIDVEAKYRTQKRPLKLEEIQNRSTEDTDEDLETVLERLGDVASHVIVVELTKDRLPFPSVRVIVPNFEDQFVDRPIPRGRAMIAKKVVEQYMESKSSLQ